MQKYTVVMVSYWDYDGGAQHSVVRVEAESYAHALVYAENRHRAQCSGDQVGVAFACEGWPEDVSLPSETARRVDHNTVVIDGVVYVREG